MISERKRPLLYMEVARRLKADIRADRFEEILPNEDELSLIYDASRVTIRSALQELRNEGVIYTLHGKGTYIDKRNDSTFINLNKFQGFYQLIQDSGHTPAIKNISLTEESNLSIDYNLPAHFFEEPIFVLKRILYADQTPAVYIKEYIPRRYLLGSTLDASPTSIHTIAKKQLRHEIAYTISDIMAVIPDGEIQELFEMRGQSPLIMLRDRLCDKSDEIITYSESYVNNLNSIRLSLIRRV